MSMLTAMRSPQAATVARRAPWVIVPLAGALWLLGDIDRYYLVYDEWGLVNRVVAGDWFREMLLGFNGHLIVFDYWPYHAQVNLVGVENIGLVYLTLLASLVALHVSAAAFLWRAGVPAIVALLAAGVVTYFGPGAETMIYPIAQHWNLVLAFIALAGFVALREDVGRSDAVVIALLLLGAIASDSGLGVLGIAFTGCLLVFLWPRSLVALALVPPFAAWLVWVVLDAAGALVTKACTGHADGNCESSRFGGPVTDTVEFAANIFVRAAGGLVGGFARAGVVALLVAGTWLGLRAVRHRLPRRAVACLVAGVGTAGVVAGSIAWSRTGFWGTLDEAIATLAGPSNRYLQPVAVFLMLGLAPAVAATFRPFSPRVQRVGTAAAALGLVIVFALNYDSIAPTQRFYEGWGQSVEADVRGTVRVLEEGCPVGSAPDPEAQPVVQSPQVTVQLVQDLLDRGALTPAFGREPSPEVLAATCAPTAGG